MKKNKLKIKVVGIGDCGINIISNFDKRALDGAQLFCMNTEWGFVDRSGNEFVKIGSKMTKGWGTGAQVYIGEKAAEEDREIIAEILKDCEFLIIVAGLGGGTGSGVTPVVIKVAKEMDIPSVAFVTTPLAVEGKFRFNNAQIGLEKLKSVTDAMLVFSNQAFMEKSHETLAKKNFPEFFHMIDEILRKNIFNVIEKLNSVAPKKDTAREFLKSIKIEI